MNKEDFKDKYEKILLDINEIGFKNCINSQYL